MFHLSFGISKWISFSSDKKRQTLMESVFNMVSAGITEVKVIKVKVVAVHESDD